MEYEVIGVRIYDYDFTNKETGEHISGKNVELHTVHPNVRYTHFAGKVCEVIKIKRSDLEVDDGQILALAGHLITLDVLPGNGKVVGFRVVQ